MHLSEERGTGARNRTDLATLRAIFAGASFQPPKAQPRVSIRRRFTS
ncbi:MAG: hypothetical protein MPW15_26430 [Candidatus Manganitrophus sp.]|nr:hypothetical protein [Candidatus Manganitrophus sp.]